MGLQWRNADPLFTHLMFVWRLHYLHGMLQCIWWCHCIAFSLFIYWSSSSKCSPRPGLVSWGSCWCTSRKPVLEETSLSKWRILREQQLQQVVPSEAVSMIWDKRGQWPSHFIFSPFSIRYCWYIPLQRLLPAPLVGCFSFSQTWTHSSTSVL